MSGVIVLPLEKHAQNEEDRKKMLKDMDSAREREKELQKQVWRNPAVDRVSDLTCA